MNKIKFFYFSEKDIKDDKNYIFLKMQYLSIFAPKENRIYYTLVKNDDGDNSDKVYFLHKLYYSMLPLFNNKVKIYEVLNEDTSVKTKNKIIKWSNFYFDFNLEKLDYF